MDYIVNVGMCSEHLVELLLVCDVAVVELRTFAANPFDSIDDFGGGVVKVVDDYDFVVCFEEREGGKGADVACSTAVILASSPKTKPMCDFVLPSDKN